VGVVGIAGGAGLSAVHPHGVDIGAVQQVFVGRGVIGLDPVDQLVLAQEFGTRGLGGGVAGRWCWGRVGRYGGR
jgi:hypothetical protein